MSELLVGLGLEKPKKMGFKETVTTVIIAALALFIGLSVASSIQASDVSSYKTSTLPSQGL